MELREMIELNDAELDAVAAGQNNRAIGAAAGTAAGAVGGLVAAAVGVAAAVTANDVVDVTIAAPLVVIG